jgi:outer membrane protein assembly factor BamD
MYKIIFNILLLFFLVSCDKKHLPRINATNISIKAQEIYQTGVENFQNKQYKNAILNFESVKSIYPYSLFAENSILKLIEIYEIKKKYDDAIIAIEELITIYRLNQNIEELRYKHAILNYKNLQKQLRDQKFIVKTANIFEVFSEEYPHSKHIDEIKEKISIINGRLVYREMEIGYFYEIQRNFIASLKRYLIAYSFSKNNKYRAEILYRIYYCYWMVGLEDEGKKYFQELEVNFKETRWYENAKMIEQIKIQNSKL